MPPVIFDCDGVLLDWEKAFAEYMFIEQAIRLKGSPQSWELHHWIGCKEKQAIEYIRRFNSSHYFRYIPPTNNAVDFVHNLYNMDVPLFILTACSNDSKVQQERLVNLNNVFGNVFQEVVCVGLGESKKDKLENFHELYGPCIYIEDNYKHAVVGIKEGHKSFCLRQSHNRAYETHYDFDKSGVVWIDKLEDLKTWLRENHK